MNDEFANTIVIFGATGDLTQRKLLPALFNQYCKGNLPENVQIVGFAIEEYTTEELQKHLEKGIQTFIPNNYTPQQWQQFEKSIHFVQGNLSEEQDFIKLNTYLEEIEPPQTNRLYYLAIAPRFIGATIQNLGSTGMHVQDHGARKIIIEKPFGTDLDTAKELNATIHQVFDESQIYRIDHYLGKETAQNILFFRFANTVFESVWNRAHIDNIQITVAERVDVGHRGGYYDQAGVMRDMIQNHTLQLLTLVAMEPPFSFEANELRNEKVKLLKSVRPVELYDTIRAQYTDYRETEGVDTNSTTPTYAALKIFIDNWRWQGVPFYLRSGKSLREKATEIIVQFKQPPRLIFDMERSPKRVPNLLSLCIQPDEGVHFRFEAKVPSSAHDTSAVDMHWHYNEAFGEEIIPEAYERLLVDALHGDASLFIRSDEIETAWAIVDPIIKAWEANNGPPLVQYRRNSWGPHSADELVQRDGFHWHLGCVHMD